MGANSIDISQYRSRIGTFAGKKIRCSTRRASCGIMLSCLFVFSVVAQQLLIRSGVESNPGPNSLGRKLIFIYLQIFHIDNNVLVMLNIAFVLVTKYLQKNWLLRKRKKIREVWLHRCSGLADSYLTALQQL